MIVLAAILLAFSAFIFLANIPIALTLTKRMMRAFDSGPSRIFAGMDQEMRETLRSYRRLSTLIQGFATMSVLTLIMYALWLGLDAGSDF